MHTFLFDFQLETMVTNVKGFFGLKFWKSFANEKSLLCDTFKCHVSFKKSSHCLGKKCRTLGNMIDLKSEVGSVLFNGTIFVIFFNVNSNCAMPIYAIFEQKISLEAQNCCLLFAVYHNTVLYFICKIIRIMCGNVVRYPILWMTRYSIPKNYMNM